MLKGKKIILGITGSIAAYKAAILVRILVREGAQVKVVMTPLAKKFITPLTLATLSKNPILVDFFDPENGAWNSHVSLGEWADAYLIAPASANTLAKMANGIADNLLLTTYLSAKCPVFVSPAMDLDMYAHPSTLRNLETLQKDGVRIIEPQSGELASGLIGKGRMEEPEAIGKYLITYFSENEAAEKKKSPLTGKKILVTAGGTVENIDSVRYISNYSSGKMGLAIADQLAQRGAEVTLIKARIDADLAVSHSNIKIIEALSAEQMHREVMQRFPTTDVSVFAAAVADYTVSHPSPTKIKKSPQDTLLTLKLTRTADIAAETGRKKNPGQLTVGFALETDHEEQNALKKLREKNLDFIVLNSLNNRGAGFGTDTNCITLYRKDGTSSAFPLKMKTAVAADIADEIERQILQQQAQ